MGDLQLALDGVPLEHLPVEDRPLDRDGGGVREEVQQLDIGVRERRPGVALEVQGTDGALPDNDWHGDLRARLGPAFDVLGSWRTSGATTHAPVRMT